MKRVEQIALIVATFLASWLGMQAVHECGHVLGSWLTGGRVARIDLHPLTISRTDLAHNPHPLAVVWAGPIFGALAPPMLWGAAALARLPRAFLLRFFAGFCLLANGLYIGIGSFAKVGDCGEMLGHGSTLWQLWLFGAITAPAGLLLWHGQGHHFGLGDARGQVDPAAVYLSLGIFTLVLAVGLLASAG